MKDKVTGRESCAQRDEAESIGEEWVSRLSRKRSARIGRFKPVGDCPCSRFRYVLDGGEENVLEITAVELHPSNQSKEGQREGMQDGT